MADRGGGGGGGRDGGRGEIGGSSVFEEACFSFSLIGGNVTAV